MSSKSKRCLPWLFALAAASAIAAETSLVFPVIPLAEAPSVDGNVAEWGSTGWVAVQVKPAVAASERAKFGLDAEDRNVTGTLTVQAKAGVYQDRLFLAMRWPDAAADTHYKGWEWNGAKYVEARKNDDMLAVRFHLDGQFDRSMLSDKTYKADLWLWSAARTNPAGLAEDWVHQISDKPIADAAEYEVKGLGTIYIKKIRDGGNPIYKVLRPPKVKGAAQLPSFEILPKPSGSVADVSAKGLWRSGYWNLEFSRKLNTGNGDDVAFRPRQKVLGQIAVFSRGGDENKSVSEPLLFDFSAIK